MNSLIGLEYAENKGNKKFYEMVDSIFIKDKNSEEYRYSKVVMLSHLLFENKEKVRNAIVFSRALLFGSEGIIGNAKGTDICPVLCESCERLGIHSNEELQVVLEKNKQSIKQLSKYLKDLSEINLEEVKRSA